MDFEDKIPKEPEVLEYFRFKTKFTAHGFVEALKQKGISFKPHSGQREILNAYEARVPASGETLEIAADYDIPLEVDYKYDCLVAACGRRFGKSEIAAFLGALELLVPHARVLIVSYTLDNCEVIYKKIRKLIQKLGIEVVIDRNKDMELELINGATLRVASVDNVESKLGTAVSLLILDEAKLFNRALYEQVLVPMLFDYAPYSRTLLISSPAAGWFETYYKRGQSDDYPTTWSINLPTHSNPTISRTKLEAMEKEMPRDKYEQEVLGLFTSAEGMVCREFNKDRHVYDPANYPFFSEWMRYGNTLVHTIDSGYSHYFASIHFLHVEELDTIFVFSEYARNKTVTSEHAKAIHELEAEWGREPDIRYADPAASQQIADFVEHELYFNKSEKGLKETIDCLNTWFFQISEITGKPKLLISNECRELIRQVSSVLWKTTKDDEQTREKNAQGVKPFEPDKDGPKGGNRTDWDLFDALRYGIYSYIKHNQLGVTVMDADAEFGDEEEDDFGRQMANSGYFRTSQPVF